MDLMVLTYIDKHFDLRTHIVQASMVFKIKERKVNKNYIGRANCQ